MTQCEYQSGKSFAAKPDAFGIRGQVNVHVGVLPVKDITDVGTKGTMAKVTFDIAALGNAKLRMPPYGNVSKSSPVYDACVASLESGEPIAFRTETIRKQGVAATTPLSKLSVAMDTVRALVAAGDHSTSEQCTDPAEDATWLRVPDEQRPDYLDVNENAANGMDTENALVIYKRVCTAQGPDSQSAIAVAAVLAIFGIDVYADN